MNGWSQINLAVARNIITEEQASLTSTTWQNSVGLRHQSTRMPGVKPSYRGRLGVMVQSPPKLSHEPCTCFPPGKKTNLLMRASLYSSPAKPNRKAHGVPTANDRPATWKLLKSQEWNSQLVHLYNFGLEVYTFSTLA